MRGSLFISLYDQEKKEQLFRMVLLYCSAALLFALACGNEQSTRSSIGMEKFDFDNYDDDFVRMVITPINADEDFNKKMRFNFKDYDDNFIRHIMTPLAVDEDYEKSPSEDKFDFTNYVWQRFR